MSVKFYRPITSAGEVVKKEKKERSSMFYTPISTCNIVMLDSRGLSSFTTTAFGDGPIQAHE